MRLYDYKPNRILEKCPEITRTALKISHSKMSEIPWESRLVESKLSSYQAKSCIFIYSNNKAGSWLWNSMITVSHTLVVIEVDYSILRRVIS